MNKMTNLFTSTSILYKNTNLIIINRSLRTIFLLCSLLLNSCGCTENKEGPSGQKAISSHQDDHNTGDENHKGTNGGNSTGSPGANGANSAGNTVGNTGNNGSNSTGSPGANGANSAGNTVGNTGNNGSNSTGSPGANGSNSAGNTVGNTGNNGSNSAGNTVGNTGNNGSNSTGGNIVNGSGQKDKKIAKKEKEKKAIVLIHGMRSEKGLDYLMGKLNAQALSLPEDEFDLNVLSINRDNGSTVNQSIADQAKDTYTKLANFISDINERDIVLLGESQGGIVAWNLFKQHPELKIRGIITNHTPWKGTPAVDVTQQKLNELKELFNKINLGIFINNTLQAFFDNLTRGQGVKDLSPASDCIKQVQANLKNTSIPIFALAGDLGNTNQDFITAFLDIFLSSASNVLPFMPTMLLQTIEESKITEIRNKVSEIIGGDSIVRHDMLVPVESQMANGISGSNFTTYFKSGYHHFKGVTSEQAVFNATLNKIKSFLQSKA